MFPTYYLPAEEVTVTVDAVCSDRDCDFRGIVIISVKLLLVEKRHFKCAGTTVTPLNIWDMLRR